ncbi:TATA-binding protein-associated phosphoprotein [Entamoeba marina]
MHSTRKTCRSATLREKHAKESRQKRDEKAIQQGVLLFLLNNHCHVSFKRPKKLARLTHQVFSVKTLQFDDEIVEVGKFVRQRCQVDYKRDIENGLTEKKAFRRYLSKKQFEMTNLLTDLCIELGYFFDFKKITKGRKGNKVDVIENVYINGKLLFNNNDILKIGTLSSEYLYDISKNVSKLCILDKASIDSVPETFFC